MVVLSTGYEGGESFDGFDDCAICRAMMRADYEKRELSLLELEQAFEEAAKDPRTVSGFLKK